MKPADQNSELDQKEMATILTNTATKKGSTF